MPNLFRTLDGKIGKPGVPIPFEFADGTIVDGIWAGSAQEEKLDWLLCKPGSQLVQTALIAAVATKSEYNEIIWGDAPSGARLFFVLLAAESGKDYRIAKMVTVAVSQAQLDYFQDTRFALFGYLKLDGSIVRILAPHPPPPLPKLQGELF